MFAAIRAEVPGCSPREPGCHPDDGVGRGGTKQSSEQDLETGLEGAVFCRPRMGAGQVVSCPLMCMSGPDIHDETANDHERFERELLAQDRDAQRPSTADFDDETARQMVRGLLDAGTVTPVVDQRILVHDPSGTAFESLLQLAVFHEGWTAAHGAGEADE